MRESVKAGIALDTAIRPHAKRLLIGCAEYKNAETAQSRFGRRAELSRLN